MKTIISLAVVAFILLGAWYVVRGNEEEKADNTIRSASSTILFPAGNERLRQGETYVLSWTGGEDPIQIFLIDRSLKGEGVSVSIVDRVYGIRNEHMYSYTIPKDMKPGDYEFQIGSETSKPFTIVPR